ncbi:MAG: tetratricopeptide repeat protein, partial [Gemmatimonadota bacterium]
MKELSDVVGPLLVALVAGLLLSPPTAAQTPCPEAAAAAAEVGWEAYRADDMTAAREAFEEALARCPSHLSALTGLGYVALRADDRDAARRRFGAVLDRNPSSVDALTGMGLLAWRKGDVEDASGRFRRVLELEPGHATAREYLDRIPGVLGPAPERPPLLLPDTLEYRSRARGDRFEVRTAGGWAPFFVKGVNLGAALPGRHPSQFPDSATYARWLGQMGEMEANVVRTYTIHPPHFYQALQDYNARHPDHPLWLVHGVWTELPEDDDYLGEAFEGRFFTEMHRVVDLLHGRADVLPRPGHASGHYTADVSDRVLAYVIGREWEPFSVLAFDSLHPDLRGWDGRYVRVAGGNAMDAWLGKAVEEIVAYETETYREQRPVAYTNWPTLDPLRHPSETTVDEEVAMREALGETVDQRPREYDNDVIGLDPSLAEPTGSFRAGLFASYHAYPYYPDFMILQDEYRRAASPFGPSSYFGYLRDLKAHHDDMPLLVAEYGVPASLGVAHLQPQGWHHGGLTEEAMARVDQRLTLELAAANTAGGIVFAWIDEWFKKNWLVIDFELPPDRNRLWYNRLDAEQHYGMLAMEPPPAVEGEGLAERLETWEGVEPLYSTPGGGGLWADWDEAYLWLLIRPGEGGTDAWRVGFDLVDPSGGDVRWPGGGGELPVGLEFVLEGELDAVRLVVDPSQNPFRLRPVDAPDGAALEGRRLEVRDPPPGLFHARREQRFNRPWAAVPNADGRYDSLRVISNRRRFTRDTVEWLATGYDRGALPEGAPPDGLWERDRDSGAWEVRIPWMLLNFTDPSGRRLLQGSPGSDTSEGAPFGTRKLDGIRMVLGLRGPDGRWTTLPGTGSDAREDVASFSWPGWEEPRWRSRRRPVFDRMRETFAALDPYDDDGLAEATALLAAPAGAPGGPPADTVAGAPPGEPRGPAEPATTGEARDAREADAAWREGDTERALTLYRARLEVEPDDVRALHRVALMLAWREEWERSLGLFDRLLTVAPDNLDARVDRARAYAWMGRSDRALAALDEVLEDDPSYRPALEARAQFQAWAGRYEASLETYDRLLSLAPRDAEVRRGQARVLTWASRFQASEAVYDSILAVDPGDLDARLGRARLFAFGDRTDEALEEYGEVLRRDPGNREAARGRARALTWGGDLVAGEEAWKGALDTDPSDAASLAGLAQNLRWQGRNAAALEVLERAERVAPSDAEVREQRRWVEAALAPRVAPSLVLEDDSDDNRMLTTRLAASWHPVPRLDLRVDAYERDLEQGDLSRRAAGARLTGAWQFEPGWTLGAGVGASDSDADAPETGNERLFLHASVSTPGRYPLTGALVLERAALDATALLAQRGVIVERVDLSGRWAPGGGWQVAGGLGSARFDGTASNRRTNGSLSATRRLGDPWTVGVSGRLFGFEKDLSDGYFDPDLYGIAEALGRWTWEPGAWSVSVEAAPGVQQVGSGGEPAGAFRASARVTWRLRPG